MQIHSEKQDNGNVIVRARSESGSQYEVVFTKKLPIIPLSARKCEEAFGDFLSLRRNVLFLKHCVINYYDYRGIFTDREEALNNVNAFLAITPDEINGIKTLSRTGLGWNDFLATVRGVEVQNDNILSLLTSANLKNSELNKNSLDYSSPLMSTIREAFDHKIPLFPKKNEKWLGVQKMNETLRLFDNRPFIINEVEDEGIDLYNERLGGIKGALKITDKQKIERADRAFQIMSVAGKDVLDKIEALPDGEVKKRLLSKYSAMQTKVQERTNDKNQSSAERAAEAALDVLTEQIDPYL